MIPIPYNTCFIDMGLILEYGIYTFYKNIILLRKLKSKFLLHKNGFYIVIYLSKSINYFSLKNIFKLKGLNPTRLSLLDTFRTFYTISDTKKVHQKLEEVINICSKLKKGLLK